MTFMPKIELVNIINSAVDDTEVGKALTVIHKDVILHPRQACQIYCSKRLIEGLIARLHSLKKNSLNMVLTLSLLNAIAACSDLYRDQMMQVKALKDSFLALISPCKNEGDEVTEKYQMQIVHEEVLKLLTTITARSARFQQDISSQEILASLKKLLSIYRTENSHSTCCYLQAKFHEESLGFSKTLMEGKKLVGKVDPDQSSEAKKGNLKILAVNIYDTTTDTDIHINQQLIDHGFACPDHFPNVGQPNKEKKTEDSIWCDFMITKVVDAHCFWAHIDNSAENKIKEIAGILEEHIYSSDVCPLHDVKVGSRVCLTLKNDKCTVGWVRGCVLETDVSTATCLVLLLDYGYVVKVDDTQLFPLPESVKDISNQANLCVLKGISAAPENTSILESTLELLCNMTLGGHGCRMTLHQMGITEDLLNLCLLGKKNLTMKAAILLSNMSLNFNIRAQIGSMNGTHVMLDLLLKYREDNEVLTCLLGALVNLLVECSQNRKLFSRQNILLILITIYRSDNTNTKNKQLVLRALKNLIGDGWKLIDPVNGADVREISDGKIFTATNGAYRVPNTLCSDELLEEIRKHRQIRIMRRGLREHEAIPDPTYASMTVEDLIKKMKGSSASDEGGGESGGPADDMYRSTSPDDREVNLNNSLEEYDGFIYKKRLKFLENEKYCFMLGRTMDKIKAIDIANTMCAMLNSGSGGSILIGVSKVGITIGINIVRKERDNLRLGVDELMGRFNPVVKHDKYEIKFLPVMIGTSVQSLEQCEERYVIYIDVSKNSMHTIYQTPAKKMFFRKGERNCEYTVQQIRQKIIAEQEQKYQMQIKALQLTLAEAKGRT